MGSPLRILQLNSAFDDDAPSQGASALARYLDPKQFHVTAVSLRTPARDSTTLRDLQHSGIEHVSMGMGNFLDGRALVRLSSYMRRVRPDIVHTHAFRADLWAGLAAQAAGVPLFVSSIRNHEWDCFRTEYPLPIARCAMAASKLATSLADVLIAVSEGVREHLISVQKVSADKIRVIPNGVDLERFTRPRAHPSTIRRELNLPPDADIVGTLAVFKPRKGLSYLLDAARTVLVRHEHVHFLLAGDGPERATLERQIQQFGLGGHVHLLGHRQDALALLDSFDVYVLPSLFEGFPRSVLEAMALGKPVVATDIGGSREAVTHEVSGLVVPPKDSAQLAGAICRLIESPTLRKYMGEAGRQAVESRLNARANAAAHEALYRKLCQTKGLC